MPIDMNDICFVYDQNTVFEKKILDHINFTIRDGEFVLICGEIGCGKSTLIKHFNGLLRPNSGYVKVDGILAHKKQIKQKVGILLQHPHKQLFARTVYEEVSFAPSNFGIKGEKLKKRVLEALELVGFTQDIEKSPFSLSGGEMRQVAIASIISAKSKYLVLDEPFCGLDHQNKMNLLAIIKKLYSLGTTIIVVAHEITHLIPLTDRIMLIQNGKIRFDGNTDDYLQSDISDLPPITSFMKKLRILGFAVRDNIYDADTATEEIIAYVKGLI